MLDCFCVVPGCWMLSNLKQGNFFFVLFFAFCLHLGCCAYFLFVCVVAINVLFLCLFAFCARLMLVCYCVAGCWMLLNMKQGNCFFCFIFVCILFFVCVFSQKEKEILHKWKRSRVSGTSAEVRTLHRLCVIGEGILARLLVCEVVFVRKYMCVSNVSVRGVAEPCYYQGRGRPHNAHV